MSDSNGKRKCPECLEYWTPVHSEEAVDRFPDARLVHDFNSRTEFCSDECEKWGGG